MAQYKRFLYYKRNTMVAQMDYVGKSLTIEYSIQAYVSNSLNFLYNIERITAQSLWEDKAPEQAWWEVPDAQNPTFIPEIVSTEPTDGALLLEDGSYWLLEDGSYWLLE